MSLARAFKTRRVKESLGFGGSSGNDRDGGLMYRNNTTSTNRSVRNKISGPVRLLSTTNMLSYTAPDIYPRTASSTTSSATAARSSDDDLSDVALTSASTPPTSPEMDLKPRRTHSSTASKAEPHHLSIFPPVPGQASASLNRMASSSSAAIGPPMPIRMIIPAATWPEPQRAAPPAIPLRAAPHRNKSYDSLARAPVPPQEQPHTKTSYDNLIAQLSEQHAQATYENALSQTWSTSRLSEQSQPTVSSKSSKSKNPLSRAWSMSRLSEQPQRTVSSKSSKSSFHTSRSSSASSGTTNTSLSSPITAHSHHLSAAEYLQQQQKQLQRDLHQLQQNQQQLAKGKVSSPISSPLSPTSASLDALFSIPAGMHFSLPSAAASRPQQQQQQQQQQQLQSREPQIQPHKDHRKDHPPSHPFGTELAQVTELVEEFQRGAGSSNPLNAAAVAAAAAHNHVHLASIADEEEEELINYGLLKFSADDYLSEIQGLITNLFGDMRRPTAMV